MKDTIAELKVKIDRYGLLGYFFNPRITTCALVHLCNTKPKVNLCYYFPVIAWKLFEAVFRFICVLFKRIKSI